MDYSIFFLLWIKANPYTGHFFSDLRLLTNHATMTSAIEPNNTGKNKKLHWYWMVFAVSKITNGFAPAGGWTQRRSCMAAIAQPTESAMLKADVPKTLRNSKPINAETKCPKITLRGWAKGDCETAYKMTQVAPKGAIINRLWVNLLSRIKIKMLKVPPIKLLIISMDWGKGARCSLPLNKDNMVISRLGCFMAIIELKL